MTMANQSVPPTFVPFDDSFAIEGRNGKPATGRHMHALATGLNAILHADGRMLFNTWDGDSSTESDHVYRTVWNHHLVPGRKLRMAALIVEPNGSRVAGQGTKLTLSDATTATAYHDYNQASVTARSWPEGATMHVHAAMADHAAAGRVGVSIGSLTANGPQLRSLMLYEPRNPTIDPSIERNWLPTEQFGQGYDILADSGGTADVNEYRSVLLHAWNRCRPQIGWSARKPGTSTNYVPFTTSSQAFRYIGNQSVGDGGTAPSVTGPGITFPLLYAGAGRGTTVRVAVYVYAAMSGATNTGSIGVSHKADASTMTAIAALTNGASISGTSYAWYPSLGSTPATFLARTDVDYERIVLCGKSSGAADSLRVAAWMITPIPSDTIT